MRKEYIGRIIMIVVLTMSAPLFAFLHAQRAEEKQGGGDPGVLERIMEESGGNVKIEIPSDIFTEMMSAPPAKQKAGNGKGGSNYKKGVNRVQGFRIMVFSDGRNPSTLQSRARARGNAIAAKFPKYRGQVYTYSKSPNWYCTVGNFKTSAEATRALGELRRAFPSFGSEMRVVNSNITIK